MKSAASEVYHVSKVAGISPHGVRLKNVSGALYATKTFALADIRSPDLRSLILS